MDCRDALTTIFCKLDGSANGHHGDHFTMFFSWRKVAAAKLNRFLLVATMVASISVPAFHAEATPWLPFANHLET